MSHGIRVPHTSRVYVQRPTTTMEYILFSFFFRSKWRSEYGTRHSAFGRWHIVVQVSLDLSLICCGTHMVKIIEETNSREKWSDRNVLPVSHNTDIPQWQQLLTIVTNTNRKCFLFSFKNVATRRKSVVLDSHFATLNSPNVVISVLFPMRTILTA